MLGDNSIMPIGKHQGTTMLKVPDAYLKQLWDNNQDRYSQGLIKHSGTKLVLDYIKDNLDAIENNLN